MTTKPRRITQSDSMKVRLDVAMDALETISTMRPRSRASRHALAAYAFLKFCDALKKQKP